VYKTNYKLYKSFCIKSQMSDELLYVFETLVFPAYKLIEKFAAAS